MATPFKRSTAVAWGLMLVAGGCAGAVATLLTSTATQDTLDSPYLVIAFLALVPLTAAAGWYLPQAGPWWGLVATAPHYVTFALSVRRADASDDASLWPVGLMFLVMLSVLPWGAGLAAALVRRRRQRHGGGFPFR